MLETMQHKASGAELIAKFIDTSPQTAAQMLEDMPLNEAVFWFAALNMETIVLAFEYMNPKKTAFILRRLPVKQSSHIATRLPAQTAALIVQNLPVHYKAKLMSMMDTKTAKMFEGVLSYSTGSAALIMRGNYSSFKTDIKVKDILLKIKGLPKNKIPFCVYITDKAGRGAGFIRTAELPTWPENALAGSVMTPAFDKVDAGATRDIILKTFKTSGAPVLAVVDADGFIIGTINVVELLDTQPPQPIAHEQKDSLLGRLFKK